MPPRPRCSSCKAQGLDKLQIETVGFYVVVYCKSCGDIHGVVPKPQQGQPQVNIRPPEKVKQQQSSSSAEPLVIDMTPPLKNRPPAPPESELEERNGRRQEQEISAEYILRH